MKTAKKMMSLLLILALSAVFLPLYPETAQAARYTDVRTSDWFYEPVQYVSDQGIMTGTGAETFSPNVVTSRGMIVTILHRMEGEPTAEAADFADVDRDRYYTKAIDWASAHGIVSGYGDGTFGPDVSITREQMASILYRYAEYKGIDTSARDNLSQYDDAETVSAYAFEVMQWAVGTGLITGQSERTLAPQTSATRAVAATILMRYCEDILDIEMPEQPIEPSVDQVEIADGDSVYQLKDDQVAYDNEENIYYVDNILLAFVKQGLTQAQKDQVAEKVDGVIVGELSGDLNLLQIEVDEAGFSALQEQAEALMRDSRVHYASVDLPVLTADRAVSAAMPDDSATGDWWQLAVNLDAAWDAFADQFGPVTVGVIDSGIDPRHQEFSGRASCASDYYRDHNEQTLSDYNASQEAQEAVDHGTHVAGIIAAEHDGDAVDGVAPNATITFADYSLDAVAASDRQQWSSIASDIGALKAVLAQGAKVINCSYGTHYPSQQTYEERRQAEIDAQTPTDEQIYSRFDSYVSYMAAYHQQVANNAQLIAAATCDLLANGEDFLIVQSAGNGVDNAGPGVEASNNAYWAGINAINAEVPCDKYGISVDELEDHILIVGGTTREYKDGSVFTMNPSFNYGDTVDIYAPGVEILSTTGRDQTGIMSGTSMAAPIVTGVAALVWSTDPSLSAGAVREAVLENTVFQAQGTFAGKTYTSPFVDAYSAVAAVVGEPSQDKGSGTADDPYKIATAEELKALADTVNQGGVNDDYSQRGVYYELTADIDLSDYENWTPIGDSALHAFSGHFDGNGHKISGLSIQDENDGLYLGLFGNAYYAEIRHITLEGVDIRQVVGNTSSGMEIGAVAGHVHGSDISDCIVTGTVSVAASSVDVKTKVGGVVGTLWGESQLSNCIASVNVQADKIVEAGGIVGRAQATSVGGIHIDGCFNTAQVLSGGDGDHSIYGYIDSVYLDGSLTTWHPTPA